MDISHQLTSSNHIIQLLIMKYSVVAVLVALCCVAFAAEQPLRSKRQLLASYVSPYVASPYVSAPYVSAPYVAASPFVASPYNGGSYYKTGPLYAPTYSSAYYSPYAYL